MTKKLARFAADGFVVGLILAALSAPSSADEATPASRGVGRQVANFVLPDTHGNPVGMTDFGGSRLLLLVFLGTECPVANSYVPVLNELQRAYPPEQLQIVGINANPSDSPEEVARHAREYEIAFPVLVDADQTAFSLLGAERTCEVFLLDRRRTLRYRGRIDDRFGYTYKRAQPKEAELQRAIDALLAGNPVETTLTEAAGCMITRKSTFPRSNQVNYAEHVAPLLNRHCVDCHHPGTAAPFSLTNYEQARDWSAMIREVVVDRRMPPWHADPRFGHFSNDRHLPQQDIDTIVAWVKGGMAAGDLSQAPPVPAPPVPATPVPATTVPATTVPEFAEGWRIGEPDIVFRMPESFTVPAAGEVKYQYFTTPTDFKEDVWIQAGECRPGNRSVVHHIIVFARDPEDPKHLQWLASTAPGAEPVIFGEGLGRRIPAGAELVWQVHYTATGKQEVDQSEVGFVFCKQPPRHQVRNHAIDNHKFQVPPGAENHAVQARYTVPQGAQVVLLSMYPHMHLRGRSFDYYLQLPGEAERKILSVPQYDFNWQTAYILDEPLTLPGGTTIRCVAHYDNSAANPANPDPTRTITWGDQTWDEMMIGYVDYYVLDPPGQ